MGGDMGVLMRLRNDNALGMRALRVAYFLSICAMLIYPFTRLNRKSVATVCATEDYGTVMRTVRDFGWEDVEGTYYHRGIDIQPLPSGKIVALCAGRVTEIGEGDGGGKFVIIDHGDSEGFYGGVTQVSVSEGDCLRAGEELGYVTEHLHFELRVNGVAVSPWEHIGLSGVVSEQ